MNTMLIYSVPAFVALFVKLWLVVNGNKRNLILKNWPLMIFFVAISVFNVIEIMTYTKVAPVTLYEYFIKWYNGSLFLALACLLILSVKTANIEILNHNKFIAPFMLVNLLIFLIIVSTDLVIAGYSIVDYGYNRIPGKYNTLAQLIALSCAVLSFTFLLQGYFNKTKSNLCQKRCRVVLLSFLPFIVCLMVFIVLLQFGFTLTGAAIIPLTTTYLLLIFVFTESEEQLFNILVRIPYTNEREAYKNINQTVLNFLNSASAGKKMNLKQFSKEIENKVVSLIIEQSYGKQVNAAEILGISASSVTRKKSCLKMS